MKSAVVRCWHVPHFVNMLTYLILLVVLPCITLAQETCYADSGWIEGEPVPCVFPFVYNFANNGSSVNVTSCEDAAKYEKYEGVVNSPSKPTNENTSIETWCATTDNYMTTKPKGETVDPVRKRWGYCLCIKKVENPETLSPTSAPTDRPSSPPTTLAPTLLPSSVVTKAPVTSFDGSESDISVSDQMAYSIVLTSLWLTSVVISLVALLTCASQSMGHPLDDISASNVAARLSYHYDRAGFLGGCLTSGMGWREAAILLTGTGKLPKMLLFSRIIAVVGAIIGVSLASGSSFNGVQQWLLFSVNLFALIVGVLSILKEIAPFKMCSGRHQRNMEKIETFLSSWVCPAARLILDFCVFVMGTAAGFIGLSVLDDTIIVAAAGITLSWSMVYVLGPCLATHTTWVGSELALLTPSIEKLQEMQEQHENNNNEEGDTQSSGNGSARSISPPTESSTEASLGTNAAISRLSVTQSLLYMRGGWGSIELLSRTLVGVLAVACGASCIGYNYYFLGTLSIVVFVLEGCIRLGLDMYTHRLGSTYKSDAGNQVYLSWKNTLPAKILLGIELVLIVLCIVAVSISGNEPRKEVSILGFFTLLALALASVLSYIALFGYAGGELQVPHNRIASLVRKTTMEKMAPSFVFPVVLKRSEPLGDSHEKQADGPPEEETSGVARTGVLSLVRKHSNLSLKNLKHTFSFTSKDGKDTSPRCEQAFQDSFEFDEGSMTKVEQVRDWSEDEDDIL
mmetsp:Transcript_39057/g.63080  ORF Transcript_39057/g.63080 Transcript_39057/m.63080 type:complete len:740 (-) Transcript_39057:1759-3978(-)